MLLRGSKAISHISKLGCQSNLKLFKDICAGSRQNYAKVAAASAPTTTDFKEKDFASEPKVWM